MDMIRCYSKEQYLLAIQFDGIITNEFEQFVGDAYEIYLNRSEIVVKGLNRRRIVLKSKVKCEENTQDSESLVVQTGDWLVKDKQSSNSIDVVSDERFLKDYFITTGEA